jgi:myo-inositol 2-dehydrogenase/D-chiro-inositol 1-dehydrogenase
MAETTRRDFLAAGAAGAAAVLAPSGVFAAADDTIKIGLIGCGGRGTGAALDTLHGNPNVKIVALGDVFEDRIKGCIANIKRDKAKVGDRLTATPETCFVGLDAYQKVLNAGVDLVILATPPGFRPVHLEAAVKAKKHIFTEKPVAVDPAGIRKVLALVEEAKKNNLAVVAGTQRRHQKGYLDTIRKLQEERAIGDIIGGRVYWNNTNSIWFHPRKRGATDLAYQLDNWYHFNWLCGDHIVEQHVHNLDVANWVLGKPGETAHPLRCVGMGGRVRPCSDPNVDGQIFDHFAVEYEYPNGVIVQSYCRQIDNCNPGDISEHFLGTKGRCDMEDGRWEINGQDAAKDGPVNRYVQEHIDLVKSIQEGKPLNELYNVAISTMTAIMGRMAAYTGQGLTWEKAMQSKLDTMPAELSWDMKIETSPVPYPGKTKLV